MKVVGLRALWRLIRRGLRLLGRYPTAVCFAVMWGFWAAIMFGVVAEYAIPRTVAVTVAVVVVSATVGAFNDLWVRRRPV